ncbi:MAG TPA: lipopolysaccharide core heptose(I) kinase RfaP [Burkholderiales bacterium]|nr:lipopolysaccharide core heptose(I) kinase RfaP [Burkholderiales bacterium]
MTEFYVAPALKEALGGDVSFDMFMNMPGEVFREIASRRTVRFQAGAKSYFVKAHRGVGWVEILKNLCTLRLPVLGAMNEWRAIRRLEAAGIRAPMIAAYGRRGRNPAAMDSFLVTEDVGQAVSLEDHCGRWPENPPGFSDKQALLREVALISRALHQSGVNHRDYYLCHFLCPLSGADRRLVLIDLHRAQVRRKVPRRWLIKDLGGLYFSAMDIGLTRRDLLRFLKIYRDRPLREVLSVEADFWAAVVERARRLYAKPVPRPPSG